MVPIVRDHASLKPVPNPPVEERSAGATTPPILLWGNPDFKRGLDLFNHGRFFDAHEVLEDLWRPLPHHSSAQRRFRLQVQGMIQIAVAFHHESTGNHVGARSVLQRALRNIEGAERSFPQLDFDRLRSELSSLGTLFGLLRG
jgi:predicted metal-dependent hydrolase